MFLNEKDYDEDRYRESFIRTMGEVFQNNDRAGAIAWLQNKKGIKMSQQLIQSMLDYRFHPNVTHGEMVERLKAKDRVIETKDNVIDELQAENKKMQATIEALQKRLLEKQH